MPKFQDFLVVENKRNHDGQKVFHRFLARALQNPGVEVLVAHHIVFCEGDQEPNEIPSADTLCFNHELMKAVFGDKAMSIMLTLCHRTPDLRDKVLGDFLDALDLEEVSQAVA